MSNRESWEEQDDRFGKWMVEGVANGWITMPVCATHSPLPLRDWEEQQMIFTDEDPCVFVMRIWHDGLEEDDETE